MSDTHYYVIDKLQRYDGRWYKAIHIESYRINDLKEVSEEVGVLPWHLLGICIKETIDRKNGVLMACHDNVIGDQGMSIGAFQIHGHWHDTSNANNFREAARWTAERLLDTGYQENPRYAVMAHNGSSSSAGTYMEEVIYYSEQLTYIFNN